MIDLWNLHIWSSDSPHCIVSVTHSLIFSTSVSDHYWTWRNEGLLMCAWVCLCSLESGTICPEIAASLLFLSSGGGVHRVRERPGTQWSSFSCFLSFFKRVLKIAEGCHGNLHFLALFRWTQGSRCNSVRSVGPDGWGGQSVQTGKLNKKWPEM